MMEPTSTPDDDKKVGTPAPLPENQPETTAAEQTQPAEDAAPAPGSSTDEGESKPEVSAQAETSALTPEKKASRRRRWASICLDAFLVLLLLAVLATAGYYFRLTAQRYHVPTPMELMLSESEELDRRYNELLPLANHADTQLHLRARLAQLEGQAARLSALIAEKKAAIDDQHGEVLAMQYAIRQADATNRSIARSLLPGMSVGDITTTTGKAYRNATIYRLDKRYIYIRFPEGQVRFPLRQLVKESLPEIARYAFGELDLVDMSDFEQTGDVSAPAQTKPTPVRRPASQPAPQEGYDPAPGTPVLDTEANRTTTSRVPEGADSHTDDTWDAPSGELPM